MPRGVYVRTAAHRRAIRLGHLGKHVGEKNCMFGKHHTPATRKKQSFAHLGKPSNRLGKTWEEIYGIEKALQMRKANSDAHKGKHHSPERVEKNRISHLGKHPSLATRKKQSLALLGKTYEEIYGIEGAKEQKKKQSGPNCHLYRDGKGNEPYGVEFTDTLKLKIRKRDDFMCQFPGCGKLENGKAHHVHHIDHNRHNNNEFNLILLDNSCHEKEKFIDLDKSINMFEDVLRARRII